MQQKSLRSKDKLFENDVKTDVSSFMKSSSISSITKLSQNTNVIKNTNITESSMPEHQDINIWKELDDAFIGPNNFSDLFYENLENKKMPAYNGKMNYKSILERVYSEIDSNLQSLKQESFAMSMLRETVSYQKIVLHQLDPISCKEEKITRIRRANKMLQKGYTCPYHDCNKSYNTRGSLRLHIRRIHKNRGDMLEKHPVLLPPVRNGVDLQKTLSGKAPCLVKVKDTSKNTSYSDQAFDKIGNLILEKTLKTKCQINGSKNEYQLSNEENKDNKQYKINKVNDFKQTKKINKNSEEYLKKRNREFESLSLNKKKIKNEETTRDPNELINYYKNIKISDLASKKSDQGNKSNYFKYPKKSKSKASINTDPEYLNVKKKSCENLDYTKSPQQSVNISESWIPVINNQPYQQNEFSYNKIIMKNNNSEKMNYVC